MEIEEQSQIQTQFSGQKQKQVVQNQPEHHPHDQSSSSSLSLSSSSSSSSSSGMEDQVKLAAMSISFNVRLRAADMPVRMQEHALGFARSIADSVPKLTQNSSLLARALKKAISSCFTSPLFLEFPFSYWEFDSTYGPAWHCVVGKSFGSFVTHSPGGFLYFLLNDSLVSVLLFKTQVQLVIQP
ncbi:hypothetical protein CRG98_023308 [Punica granatum]|uniref:Dynein light chain n=1 Tax=Punica granatum TaxID=22663 RepID=A0A2I0JJ43_PUNGR|nr:hypothetical protein CRG98_023308 [Punica granatum]